MVSCLIHACSLPSKDEIAFDHYNTTVPQEGGKRTLCPQQRNVNCQPLGERISLGDYLLGTSSSPQLFRTEWMRVWK